MKFHYQARTKEGNIQKGIVEASSREAALNLLEKYGLFVTLLEKKEEAPFFARKIKILERVSRGEIVAFSRQLAIMFRSKIPIVEIFYTLAKQTKNQFFKSQIERIAEDIEGGSALSLTLEKHPKIFSPFYVSMVKSGEVSGTLSEVLDYLADHLEREHEFKSKLVGAMIYPILVLAVVFIVIIAMLVFVVPKLATIFEDFEAQIPRITQILLSTSEFARTRGWILILIFLGAIILFIRWIKTKHGKEFLDRLSLKVPILGNFLKKVYLARFAENLSTLIEGGLPIATALEVTSEVIGNDIYKALLQKTRDEVRRGVKISSVLEKYPDFVPPLVFQMTVVGEKTGRMAPALRNVVTFYKKDVDRTLDNFVSVLEPLLIIFLGIIVAGIVISVLMPIYQIGMMAM